MKCKLCNGKIGRYTYKCKECGAAYKVQIARFEFFKNLILEILINLNAPLAFLIAYLINEPLFLLLIFVPIIWAELSN